IIGISKINIVIPDVISGIGLALLFAMTIIPLQINLGFATIILSHISFCTPYAIILIYPRMQKMNKNLILASLDLGYSSIYTFFKVIIPFLIPSIISAAALVFGMSFDDFIITRLVGGKIDTISTQIYSMAKGIKMWAVTFGAIVVVVSIGLAILIAFKNTIFKKRSQTNRLGTKNE
ncbi:MAG: ABC transporter permease subunit, partial [Ureaplasma sp.]|nr:ABC transporter permease subunit [Ureaplasma sp.]